MGSSGVCGGELIVNLSCSRNGGLNDNSKNKNGKSSLASKLTPRVIEVQLLPVISGGDSLMGAQMVMHRNFYLVFAKNT